MTEFKNDHESREQQFDRLVLLEYYEAVEREETPKQADLIAKYPEFSEKWRSFFGDLREVIGTVDGPAEIEPNIPVIIRDYQLLKKIGEGGMGTVYLAVHTQLEKQVAIKLLKGDRESDMKRFETEIKAVGRVEHDHVVRALDAGKVDGLYYLVMEFIDGVDLSQLLVHGAPLPITEACELVRQSALGIGHAHQHRMIHRDIKPSNLMLSSAGQVKLLDLGLAQLHQTYQSSTRLTVDGQAMGTLKYMAPEQFIDCKNVDPTCDIYSLGVTLFELLYGELPISGVRAVVDCEKLQKLRSEISDDLIELIRSMTSEQPSLRVQHADEVADRLASWSNDHDLTSLFARHDQQTRQRNHPPPAPPKSRAPSSGRSKTNSNGGRWSRKRVLRTAAFAALFLAALAAPFLMQPAANEGLNVPPPDVVATLDVVVIDPHSEFDGSFDFDWVIIDESSGEAYRLKEKLNRVPPGSYELSLDGWTSSIPSPILLEPSSLRALVLMPPEPVTSKFPVQFPEIPRTAGAWARFKARIIPAGASEQEIQTYEVILRCLETKQVGDKEFRWIQTEVGNSEYRETATLLIDAEMYELEQKLSIHEGFINAVLPSETPPILETLNGLPVWWSDDEDLLEELAKDWGFRWPQSRISTQSLLTMIFELSHPAVPPQFSDMRNLLGSSTRQNKERFVSHAHGTAPSLRITAMPENSSDPESEIGYMIERAIDGQETPFSFLYVDIRNPQFRVTLSRSNGNLVGAVRNADQDQLGAAADELAKLDAPEFVDFTRASLPANDGEFARYNGTVMRGTTTLAVDMVEVRAGKQEPVGNRMHRWIEVEVSSGVEHEVERVKERVILLVDELAYQDRKEFVVSRGWHELGGEVFDLRKGDAKPAELSLTWLEHPPVAHRFKVHEVLTLLFAANLPSSGPARGLRGSITASITADSAERLKNWRAFDDIPGKSRIEGYRVTFRPEQKQTLQYTIDWSENVPFGFVKVFLEIPNQFNVSTALTHFGIDHEHHLDSDTDMRERAKATTKKLSEMGVRVWELKNATTPYLVGEYGSYYEQKVTLRTAPDTSFNSDQKVRFEDLSPIDQEWILKNKSRTWEIKGEKVRGLVETHEGSYFVLLKEDFTREIIMITELIRDDRLYLEERLRSQ